jgi:capsular exopolysaccharide synthesis family protein
MEENQTAQLDRFHSLSRITPEALQEQGILDVSPEEVPHLIDYWQVALKRRWTVLICLVVVFVTVVIGTLKQKPIYQGKVLVEINPEEPSVVNFREVAQVAPTVDVDSYRETQYKILTSRSLAEHVIRDLQLYQYPEFYKARLLFGLIEISPAKIPSARDLGPPDASSDAFRTSVANFLKAVDVSPVRRSNLVELSFECTNPQLAARVANRLADLYIEQNLQVKWDETQKASEWLRGRLAEMKANLEKSEDKLQAYAQGNGILYITEKQNMVTERLDQLLTEYTKAQGDRYQKQSLYSQVEAGQVQNLPAVLNNRLIQDLEEKRVDLDKQYAEVTTWVKPNYPKARQVKKQIDALQSKIDEEKEAVAQNITDDYHAAEAREKYLAKAVEDQKAEVNDTAQRSIQYNILKRDVDSNKQLYEGLLQRLKEAQVSAGLKASNIRIVDSAEVPKGPVKPRVLLNLALGIILGLGLGVGLAFFQEYLDKTLKTPDEVERLLRLPSLGVLPKFHLNGSGPVDEESLVPAVPDEVVVSLAPAIQTKPESIEAFRSLRTSILLSASPVPKLILVTSALPGEGKTTTAVNLGATLTSLGSKVVIVDCDMRRPSCHCSLGVPNSPGFVQCVTGRVALRDALLAVPGVPNLSVIPCGPIPPNPAEILSSPLAGELLRKLRAEFDYVLVDSPPLLSVADSRILATVTDAAVLVARAFETPYDIVRRARALLYSADARILGVALNGVDISRDSYTGVHAAYRQGHGYGYGYGSNGDQETIGEGVALSKGDRVSS